MNDEMKEILNDFLAESAEMLEALDQNFVQLESDPNNRQSGVVKRGVPGNFQQLFV